MIDELSQLKTEIRQICFTMEEIYFEHAMGRMYKYFFIFFKSIVPS